MLARFHQRQPQPWPVAWEDEVHRLDFDYTQAAVARVASLLSERRGHIRQDPEAFIADRGQREFLLLLCCLVGEATARYLGKATRWFAEAGYREQMAKRGLQPGIPEGFISTLVCEIEGRGFLAPLGLIMEQLFADSPRILNAELGRWMPMSLAQDRLEVDGPIAPGDGSCIGREDDADRAGREQGAADSAANTAAGVATERAAALAKDMGLLARMQIERAMRGAQHLATVASSRPVDGPVDFVSYVGFSDREALERGMALLEQAGASDQVGALTVALAYDGYVSLPMFRSDAIRIEGRAGPDLRLSIAIPYRPADARCELVVHAPRLVGGTSREAQRPAIREAFLAEFAAAAGDGWTGYFVAEDDPRIVALREADLPAPAWLRYVTRH